MGTKMSERFGGEETGEVPWLCKTMHEHIINICLKIFGLRNQLENPRRKHCIIENAVLCHYLFQGHYDCWDCCQRCHNFHKCWQVLRVALWVFCQNGLHGNGHFRSLLIAGINNKKSTNMNMEEMFKRLYVLYILFGKKQINMNNGH